MERHGGALRADLQRVYGVSLREALAGSMTPDELMELIDHLPRDCALMDEVAADPAAILAEEARAPLVSEWSPEVDALAHVNDLLSAILAHLSALTSKRPVRLDPYRRPVIAAQEAARARAQRARLERHRALVARVLPRKGGQHG